jgi:hypothetical protein
LARVFQQPVSQSGTHPVDVLGDAWAIMLGVRELYKTELMRCRSTLDNVQWFSPTVAEKHLHCNKCGSDLIEQRDPSNTNQEELELICRTCGLEPEWDSAIADAVWRALSSESYERFKDTGELGPIYECPSCQLDAYIDTEDACAVCGETFEYKSECSRCFTGIPIDDALAGFNAGLCSYCTNVLSKDD